MKKLLLISLLAFNANAEFTKEEEGLCKRLESVSAVVMQSRQEGIPMSEMIELAKGNATIISVIEDAFNEPRWSSSETITRAIQDFSNESYKLCYEAFKD